jgi:putative permease
MLQVFRKWADRYFADEQAIFLLLVLFAGLFVILSLGDVLAPFIASLILAYLMQGLVSRMLKAGLQGWMSLVIVFALFIGAYAAFFVVLLPLIWRQTTNLVAELPGMLERGQQMVLKLPEKYPGLISPSQLQNVIEQVGGEVAVIGQSVLSLSVESLPGLIAWLVYLILVPILVFFLLKDKDLLLGSISSALPARRDVLNQVLHEMNDQIANYVRGKAVEILIVGSVSLVAFQFLGLKYAVLLGVLVGLSVIIPYIGASVVTIPVLLVGYFQWGTTTDFWWLFVVYFVIQILDGNVLVPLLFSEAVNLHPVAIILAVLVFGGLWGFWGVFFAIPLATLIKAVMRAWPSTQVEPANPDEMREEENPEAAES